MVTHLLPAAIPSPTVSEFQVGPLTIHIYALCIIAGIFLAVWLSSRRYEARGGPRGSIIDIAFWAVPFGIVGARIYHVASDPELYFAPGENPWRAFAIWDGGLGIWGAIAGGALGAYIGARRLGLRFAPIADAIAPTLLFAQAIGRFGNWFNNELFGAPTTLPWGLKVSDQATLAAGYPVGTLFQPTFLYEALWDAAMGFLLLWIDRRWRLGHGRVFWLYVVCYTSGRVWIEMLRVDHANTILGLRLNVWTSILVGLAGLVVFIVLTKTRPGREEDVFLPGRTPSAAPAADENTDATVALPVTGGAVKEGTSNEPPAGSTP